MNIHPVRFALFFLVWIGAGALALALVGLIFGVVTTPVLGCISPLSMLLFVPIIAGATRNVRKREALAIIAYIEQAARLGLPITHLLESAASGESPRIAQRMYYMKELIEAGAPLDVALTEAAPDITERSIRKIRAALQTGRLQDALMRIINEGRRIVPRDVESSAFIMAYPIMMTIFLSGVVTVIAVYVFPKYESIFSDFGMVLPPVTRTTVEFMRQAGPLFLAVFLAVGLAFLGRILWEVFHPLGPGGHGSISDWLLSKIPPTRGIIRHRDYADTFEVMADATESGLPLDEAIGQASELQTFGRANRIFSHWKEQIRAGIPPVDAARSAGAPDLAVGLLASAQAVSDVPQVLRFLSRYYRDKFSRTLIVIRAALIPIMVFIFAIPVVWISLSLLMPMINMIDALSGMALHTGRHL